ncbi:CBS domain-containing protein [Anaeromyxobacter diazotrophicus]|uniref:CBS domain-containing protein n=1 Tax=Anaeromyxobacter diazotrophicus TaxID=2590199 RepID=A0A7I9VKQ3_9BACT|nr:CBS domain-containing protein [Anaeromyxobacter diazotrophicus]GEJ56758.1 hypothetical protein AMYX_14990 [Anaeromyxobacter diazotrophicus]
MPTVRDVLAQKNSAVVYTCAPGVTLAEASRLLCDRGVGCLVVADDDGAVQGVLSDRDVVRAVAAGRDPARTPVAQAMSTSAAAVELEAPLEEVARLLRRRRVRHLPVVGRRGLLGVVSLGDLARFYTLRERASAEAAALQ